jgi:hypothetical protein
VVIDSYSDHVATQQILVIMLWFSEPEYWFRNGTPVNGIKIIVLFVATT